MGEIGTQETQEITKEQSLDANIMDSYENLLGVFKALQVKRPDVFKYPTVNVFEKLRKDKGSIPQLPWPLNQEGGQLLIDDYIEGNDSIAITWQTDPNTRETIEIGRNKFPGIHTKSVPLYRRVRETRQRNYDRWEKKEIRRYGDEYMATNSNTKSSLSYDEYLKSDDKLLLDKVTESLRTYAGIY